MAQQGGGIVGRDRRAFGYGCGVDHSPSAGKAANASQQDVPVVHLVQEEAVAVGRIKEETKATIRCYPLVGQEEAEGRLCFYTGRPANRMALFARAY